MDAPAREQGLRELAKQLRILERYAIAEPYLVGPSETTGKHLAILALHKSSRRLLFV